MSNYYKRQQVADSLLLFFATILIRLIYIVKPIGSMRPVLLWAFIAVLVYMIILLMIARYWLLTHFPDDIVWLHPPILIILWIIIAWGVPGLYSLLQPKILTPVYTWTRIDLTYSVPGFILITAGCFTLLIGYFIGLRIFKPSLRFIQLAKIRLNPNLLITFYMVTVLIGLLEIRVTGIAYGADVSNWGKIGVFQQLIGYIIDINLLILAIYVLMTIRKEISQTYLIIVVVLQLLTGFTSGFIKPVFWLILIILLTAVSVRVKNIRIIALVCVLLLMAIVVMPIAENLRSQIDAGIIQTQSVRDVVNTTVDAFKKTWLRDATGSLDTSIKRSIYRQALVAQTPGIIMRRTPKEIPFEGIEQFLAIPAYVIPRAIWADKPILSRGNWFGITYLNYPTFITSSAAITVFGEGYMYAGWIGTILACFILGLLLSYLYRKTVSSNFNPHFSSNDTNLYRCRRPIHRDVCDYHTKISHLSDILLAYR